MTRMKAVALLLVAVLLLANAGFALVAPAVQQGPAVPAAQISIPMPAGLSFAPVSSGAIACEGCSGGGPL